VYPELKSDIRRLRMMHRLESVTDDPALNWGKRKTASRP
jgi:hypothetical protein